MNDEVDGKHGVQSLEIGMGIHPDQSHRSFNRHRGHGTNGNGMVTAQKNRHTALVHDPASCFIKILTDLGDFFDIPVFCPFHGRIIITHGDGDTPFVLHIMPKPAKLWDQSGVP